jgi:hypothetical protein
MQGKSEAWVSFDEEFIEPFDQRLNEVIASYVNAAVRPQISCPGGELHRMSDIGSRVIEGLLLGEAMVSAPTLHDEERHTQGDETNGPALHLRNVQV